MQGEGMVMIWAMMMMMMMCDSAGQQQEPGGAVCAGGRDGAGQPGGQVTARSVAFTPPLGVRFDVQQFSSFVTLFLCRPFQSLNLHYWCIHVFLLFFLPLSFPGASFFFFLSFFHGCLPFWVPFFLCASPVS